MARLILPLCLVLALPSCGTLGGETSDLTPYQSALADFSLCETSPDPAERTAAAARLAEVAAQMAADAEPGDELDRVIAANAHCQAGLAAP